MITIGEKWHYLAVKELQGIASNCNGNHYYISCPYSFATENKFNSYGFTVESYNNQIFCDTYKEKIFVDDKDDNKDSNDSNNNDKKFDLKKFHEDCDKINDADSDSNDKEFDLSKSREDGDKISDSNNEEFDPIMFHEDDKGFLDVDNYNDDEKFDLEKRFGDVQECVAIGCDSDDEEFDPGITFGDDERFDIGCDSDDEEFDPELVFGERLDDIGCDYYGNDSPEISAFLLQQIKCRGNYMRIHFALALPRQCFA